MSIPKRPRGRRAWQGDRYNAVTLHPPVAHGTERHRQKMKLANGQLKARPPSPLTGGY
jgi:hypothetical protein